MTGLTGFTGLFSERRTRIDSTTQRLNKSTNQPVFPTGLTGLTGFTGLFSERRTRIDSTTQRLNKSTNQPVFPTGLTGLFFYHELLLPSA